MLHSTEGIVNTVRTERTVVGPVERRREVTGDGSAPRRDVGAVNAETLLDKLNGTI